MIQHPIVSTITPCYKMEKYLELFLEELPKQKIFDKLEVVLDHNDPSEQEIALVKNFQERYPGKIKHLITTPVSPIGISMNKCIKESSGKFLAIWNVDDLRTKDSLLKQVNLLVNNPNISVSHGNFIITKEFGLKHGKFIDHSHTISNPKELERGMCLGPFFMFRKEAVEKIGYFDEQLKSGADFDLAVRLAKNFKIGMTHGILGYYLDEQRGLSTRGDGVQPIERTVVEMRYGIYDKIDPRYVPFVEKMNYDVKHIINDGKKITV